MNKNRIFSLILIVVFAALGYGLYLSQKPNSWFHRFPFVLGLDLNGGTELTYKADISQVPAGDISGALDSLHEIIERRVNIFGVSEPQILVEKASALAGRNDYRLIVDLPGVTNIDKAVQMIGQTPLLEFKLVNKQAAFQASLASTTPVVVKTSKGTTTVNATVTQQKNDQPEFIPTGLTGSLLQRASVQFDSTTNRPIVSLAFNSAGTDLFAKITKEHVGEPLAIFLDGKVISAPVIREEIRGGTAQISGNFTTQEAQTLVRNLNYGALPLPIELVGTQLVGPSLGAVALKAGLMAGIWGFLLVIAFLIIWYRVPGIIASVALVMYIILSMFIFKLIPVTLTAAGIAGFILSIGMAVDANILIFERMKEELAAGRNLLDAMHEGFHRAWLSIRDSNISSIITAIVLFWVGTSAVKGFALTFGIGVLVSMFTAITVSRNFLYSVATQSNSGLSHFLFGAGLRNPRPAVPASSANKK